jgi:DNA-binding MarR family transcriptional regulator
MGRVKPRAAAPAKLAAAVPLARLFAMAYRQLIDGLHARLAAHGHHDVRPSYGYVLLAARDAPVAARELADLLGVTKQAASQLIDAMEAGGYVQRRDDPQDARAKLVALTPRGRRFLATVEAIYSELEDEWAAVTGRHRLEAIRQGLTAVLEAAHDGKLPRVRPTP